MYLFHVMVLIALTCIFKFYFDFNSYCNYFVILRKIQAKYDESFNAKSKIGTSSSPGATIIFTTLMGAIVGAVLLILVIVTVWLHRRKAYENNV